MSDDVTGKIFVGVIDTNRFDEAQRSATERDLKYYMRMHSDVNYMPMKITLYDKVTEKRNSVYYKKDKYDEFSTYVAGAFSIGKGGYSKYEFDFPVAIGDLRRPGVLYISITIPNS